jgi:hypothetical protein
MRRMMIIGVCLILTLTLGGAVSFAAEYDLSTLDKWEIKNGSPQLGAIDGQSGIKLMPPTLDGNPTGDYIVLVFPEGVKTETITVDFKVWLGGVERGLVLSLMGSPKGHDDWVQSHAGVLTNYSTAAVYLAFDQGQLRYFVEKDRVWRVICSANAFEWISFSLIVNPKEKYFDMYQEGQFKGSGTYRREEIDNISALGFLIYQGAKPAEEAYVSDVKVSLE